MFTLRNEAPRRVEVSVSLGRQQRGLERLGGFMDGAVAGLDALAQHGQGVAPPGGAEPLRDALVQWRGERFARLRPLAEQPQQRRLELRRVAADGDRDGRRGRLEALGDRDQRARVLDQVGDVAQRQVAAQLRRGAARRVHDDDLAAHLVEGVGDTLD